MLFFVPLFNRSANFYSHSGLCELSEMDRITLAGSNSFDPYDGADYLENNCAEEPNKLCEFKRISGKILKTVDSVYQDIASIEDCRELCLGSPYRYGICFYIIFYLPSL